MRGGDKDDVGFGQEGVHLVGLDDAADHGRVGLLLGIDAEHGHAEGPGAGGDLAADAADADDEGGTAVEFDAVVVVAADVAGELVIGVGAEGAGEVEQEGEGVVGDFGALDDAVVGEDDGGIAEVVGAGEEEGVFDAGAGDLDPFEFLGARGPPRGGSGR